MKQIKKIALLTLTIIGFSSFVNAQQDAQAKKILDNLSKITKQYKNISADFTFTMNNEANDVHSTQKGKLTTEGKDYYLKLAGQEIYCNGQNIWTYLIESNEVQINKVPEESEKSDNYIDPSSIFTIYNKGFKYSYKGEKKINGNDYQIIELYPDNPKGKNFHTIVLTISKSNPQIKSIEIKGKNGTNFTYAVTSFKTNQDLPIGTFTFNKSQHSDVEVTDLR